MSDRQWMGRASTLVLGGILGLCVAMLLNSPGFSTPLGSEAYLRLSVASAGGNLRNAKGPFVSQFFPAGRESLLVHLAPEEPLGTQKVDAITEEIQDAAKGFAAGYRAHHAGYDPRRRQPDGGQSWEIPAVPDGILLPDIWRTAFLQGWRLAEDE